MGSYTKIQNRVFSVFGLDSWKAENIVTLPSNFTPQGLGSEYIRVAVLAGANHNGGQGIVNVDILTPAGQGPTRAAEIADLLEKYFASKSFSVDSDTVQFFDSNLGKGQPDYENPTLCKTPFTLNFKYFGAK